MTPLHHPAVFGGLVLPVPSDLPPQWAAALPVAADALIGLSFAAIAVALIRVVALVGAVSRRRLAPTIAAFLVAYGADQALPVAPLLAPHRGWLLPIAQAGAIVAALALLALLLPALPRALALVAAGRAAEGREAELTHQAFHDPLTGLPNRALFLDRLQQAVYRAGREPGSRFAILFLDLDHLKRVNDSLGHPLGDKLLVALARRLETCLRPGDTLARFGGDEFAILLAGITGARAATVVAERIHQRLQLPFRLEGHELFVTTSIGIALEGPAYEQPEELLRDADIALYRAKGLGRGRHVVFDEGLHAEARSAMQLESDLRRAIEQEEFRLHYQPVAALATGRLAGFATLLHWQHPERGAVPPEEFLPLAEETGLIAPLGWWVLREACHQLRLWEQHHAPGQSLTISVPLSARQLAQPDLIERVAAILRETGVAPRQVRLALSERALMEHAGAAPALLARLRALAVQVQIDDFGTGNSSLAYLQRYAADVLTIDRSFISEAGRAGEDAAIVRALVMLAHSLRMQVVAAGVETAEQLTHLRAVACDWAHGPQVSRPLTAAQADALLGQTSPMQLLSPSGPGGAARQTRAGQIRMEGAPRRP